MTKNDIAKINLKIFKLTLSSKEFNVNYEFLSSIKFQPIYYHYLKSIIYKKAYQNFMNLWIFYHMEPICEGFQKILNENKLLEEYIIQFNTIAHTAYINIHDIILHILKNNINTNWNNLIDFLAEIVMTTKTFRKWANLGRQFRFFLKSIRHPTQWYQN